MPETLPDFRPDAPADALPPGRPSESSTAGSLRVKMRVAVRAMNSASDADQIHGNTARLLPSSSAAFTAWLENIQRAERYVHL